MAVTDDQLSYELITELDGVQMSNTRYFEIDDIGDDPTPASMLNDIVNHYYDSIKIMCGAAWKIVCANLHNHTQVTGDTTIFVTLLGMGPGDTHPQHQVVRHNIYAQEQPANIIHRGAFNQSGIIETKSFRDRVGDPSDYDALNQHLFVPGNFGGTGWAVSTLVRYNAEPDPLQPFIEAFANVRKVNLNTQFKTLRSRKTKLCAVQ